MQNRFCIAPRDIPMPRRFEFRTHIGVIKNLAVVDDLEGPVLVRHRLMAGGHVDDAETAVG
jgi:hypothetical protein